MERWVDVSIGGSLEKVIKCLVTDFGVFAEIRYRESWLMEALLYGSLYRFAGRDARDFLIFEKIVLCMWQGGG